jgi:hypothetical protein
MSALVGAAGPLQSDCCVGSVGEVSTGWCRAALLAVLSGLLVSSPELYVALGHKRDIVVVVWAISGLTGSC